VFDLVIKGGTVIDGTGKRGPFKADVAVRGRAIARIDAKGDLGPSDAREFIDASGLMVMPGVIDIHSHSDLSLPVHGNAASSLLQGITTEVVGSCGWSLAPCKKETIDTVLKGLVGALLGEEEFKAIDWEWRSFGEYLTYLKKRGTGTNVYPLVGQSLLRAHIVGTEKRPPTPGEVAAMQELLEQCLVEGGHGLSTGRSYLPGGHADTAEIIDLAAVVAAYGGIYTSHIKSEADQLIEAVQEVIDIADATGVKAQVSHHKAIGAQNFGKVKETLSMLEGASEDGLDVSCDVYPYDFAQVYQIWRSIGSALEISDGDKLKEAIKSQETRIKLKEKYASEEEEGKGLIAGRDNYRIMSSPSQPGLAGKTLGQGAEDSGQDLVDFVCDLLLEDEFDLRVAASMDERDVQAVIKHPLTMISTDAFALDQELEGSVPIHPRHYGTYPRVLGHYARDIGLVDLTTMVHKVSGLPGRKLGLTDRGTLAVGNWADMVVFDAAEIGDRATANNPYSEPKGITAVVVNGSVAVRNGKVTGARNGMVI